jgi:Methyltransferase domain
VAELGVWHGGTSVRLRAAMAADGTFYAIDPYEKGRLGFSIPRVVGRREVDRVRNGRVIWVRKADADAARSPEIRSGGPFDFVFVDDAQTYEMLRVEWGRIGGSARRAPSLTRRRCRRWPSGCVCCSRICRKADA